MVEVILPSFNWTILYRQMRKRLALSALKICGTATFVPLGSPTRTTRAYGCLVPCAIARQQAGCRLSRRARRAIEYSKVSAVAQCGMKNLLVWLAWSSQRIET